MTSVLNSHGVKSLPQSVGLLLDVPYMTYACLWFAFICEVSCVWSSVKVYWNLSQNVFAAYKWGCTSKVVDHKMPDRFFTQYKLPAWLLCVHIDQWEKYYNPFFSEVNIQYFHKTNLNFNSLFYMLRHLTDNSIYKYGLIYIFFMGSTVLTIYIISLIYNITIVYKI